MINYIDENFPDNRRDYLKFRREIAEKFDLISFKKIFRRKIGLNEQNSDMGRLTYKHYLEEDEFIEINHNESNHSMALQKSHYICIDHNNH